MAFFIINKRRNRIEYRHHRSWGDCNYVVEAIAENPSWNMHVKSIYVRDKEKYADFAAKNNIVLYQDVDAFLDSDIDIVVEAANVEAVEMLLPVIVKRKSVVIISIGA